MFSTKTFALVVAVSALGVPSAAQAKAASVKSLSDPPAKAVAPGAYFIVACPARGRGSCAVSRRATIPRMGDGSIAGDSRSTYVFVLEPGDGATIGAIGARTHGTYFSVGGSQYTEHTTITVTHTPAKYTPLEVK